MSDEFSSPQVMKIVFHGKLIAVAIFMTIKFLKIKGVFLFGWLMLYSPISLQAGLPNLTLSQFLQTLQKQHPLIKQQQLASSISEQNFLSTLGAQDLLISAAGQVSVDKEAFVAPNLSTDSRSHVASVALVKPLWYTGGRLEAGYSQGFMRELSSVSTVQGYSNRVFARWVQPLLQNKGGSLTRLEADVAELEQSLVQWQALEQVENFILEQGLIYLNWMALHASDNILVKRLNIARDEVARIRKKRQSNLVPQLDLIRAREVVVGIEQSLEQIRSESEGLRHYLAVTLEQKHSSLTYPDTNWEQEHFFKALSQLSQLPDLESDTHLRLLNSLTDSETILMRQHQAAQDARRAELDLAIEVGLDDLNPDWADSFRFDQPDVQLGLQYTFPFKNRRAIHTEKRLFLQIKQLRLERASIRRTLAAQRIQLRQELMTLLPTLTLNQKQLSLALRKTKEEIKRYQQGRNDFTFVLQSQDNEQAVRQSRIDLMLKLHSLYLQYLAVSDQLLLNDFSLNLEAGI